MTNRLTKLSVTTYTPAVPAVAGQPARCYTTEVQTTVYDYLGSEYGVKTVNGKLVLTNAKYRNYKTANFIQQLVDPQNQWSVVGYAFYYVYTKTTKQTICDPAVAAVPAQPAKTSVSSQPGWNSGARSRDSISGDFLMEFDVSAMPVGVACGVTAAGNSDTTSIGAISHGILATASQFAVLESGKVIAYASVTPADAQSVSIRRVGTKVTYQIGSWTHDSTQALSGSCRMQACLYTAGDYVDNPKMLQLGSLAGSSYFGWEGAEPGVEYMRGSSTFGWDTDTPQRITMDVKLPAIASRMSDRPLKEMKVRAPVPAFSGYGGMPTITTGGFELLLPMTFSFSGNTGEIGGMDVALPAIQGVMSDRPYGFMTPRLPALRTSMLQSSEAPNNWAFAQNILLADSYIFEPTLFAMIYEGLSVGSSIDLLFYMTADFFEYLAIGDVVSVTMILEALITSGLRISDNVSQARRDLIQYATNVATGDVTRYENFGFTSFAQVGMRTFGVKADGLYELEGDTDDGELRRGVVDFLTEDFGSAERKSVSLVYLGMATDGQVFLRVTTDRSVVKTYRVVNHGDTCKVRTAQGVRSRYWQARLEIVDATEAEVVNIEWFVAGTGRRVGR